MKIFKNSNYDATILLCEVDNPSLDLELQDVENDKIIKITEKPKNPTIKFSSNWNLPT